jgi:hypothetical protein
VGLAELLLYRLTPRRNDVEYGLIKEPFQNPYENEEIYDFQDECRPTELHACGSPMSRI